MGSQIHDVDSLQTDADGVAGAAGAAAPDSGLSNAAALPPDAASPQQWLNRAALYEILALGLRLPTPELAEALVSGEFADALAEIGTANQLDDGILGAAVSVLDSYRDGSTDALFHKLRTCYTGLLVGAPEPAVSPYAGVWWARAQGVEPLLFVNKRSMDIERFMRNVGIGQAEGRNEPLDHIATMLEFLQYTALVLAGAAEQPAAASTAPATGDAATAAGADGAATTAAKADGAAATASVATEQYVTATAAAEADIKTAVLPALITPETPSRFITDFLADWALQFSTGITEKTEEPLYIAVASVLAEL